MMRGKTGMQSMRTILGTILGTIVGCLLTVAAAYVHDTVATSSVTAGSSATQVSAQLVNWNVAAREWGRVKDGVRTTWLRLTNNVG
jgi:hypothetical protein